MKKNLYYGALAAITGFMAVSCSNEFEPQSPADGPVVITAKMPAGLASRAISDGTKATTLHYAVYESGTKNVIFTSATAGDPVAVYNNDLTFSLSLNLVKGQTYDLIFWADCGTGSPYTFSATDQNVSVDYTGIKSNEETRDAFFSARKGMLVKGAMSESIQLYRPFAQLNIGTNDVEIAKKAKIEYKQTAVTVKNVYKTLNLYSGVASDAVDMTYDYAEAVTPDAFPVSEAGKTYTYMAMNYILTGDTPLSDDINKAQKETKDVTIAIKDVNDKVINTFDVSAVPFQRNYRTNIYGALLTSTVDYKIIIEPDYNLPDYSQEVNDYTQLTKALEKGGNVTVAAGSAITVPEGQEAIELKDGTNLTINGTVIGSKTKGIFKVPAGANVTIDGTGTVQFNYAGNDYDTRYSFRGIDVEGKAVVKNIEMVCPNRTAGTAIHVAENAEATLENVKVNTGFRAINTQPGAKLTVKGGEFHSTSNNGEKASNGQPAFTYCIYVYGNGTVGNFEDVTVTGIQGGISYGEGSTGTVINSDISTRDDLPGMSNKAFYAIYSHSLSKVTIESGKFFAPNRAAVVVSNDDVSSNPIGSVIIKGGIFKSVAKNTLTNMDVPLPDGYKWVDNDDAATKDRYPFKVVASN